MLCLLLTVLLLMLLVYAYKKNKKEICSPAVLFIAPFVVMCIIATAFSRTWNFDLHLNTFLVVLVGCIFFLVGTNIGRKIKIKQGTNNAVIEDGFVSSWKYILFLIIQLVCYYIKIQTIMKWGSPQGAKTLSQALVLYNNAIKFGESSDIITYPSWISIGLSINEAFGFVIACILAQKVVLHIRNRKSMFWILVCFGVAVIGGASSGGRGGAVQVCIAFITAYLILYQRKSNWEKSVPLKQLVMVGLLIIGLIVLFVVSLTWVGRFEVHKYGRYICNYIGAQIYNLDFYLNNGFESANVIGMYTFSPLFHKIGSWFNIRELVVFYERTSFVWAAGYNTGNVYTAFYNYLRDFHILGIIILPVFFGIISQLVYKASRSSSSKHTIHLALIVYSNLSYIIMFSFFSDRFGTLLFAPTMIKKIMIMWVMECFLFDFRLQGNRIVIGHVRNERIFTAKYE